MSKYSLHFGVNRFDEDYYGPGNELKGCENDAKFHQSLALKNGFQSKIFLSEDATYERYMSELDDLIPKLVAGDTFFFSASCHGTFQEHMEEGRVVRQTALCLHNRIVWDYETKQFLMRIPKGVLLFWMTDCCHSRDNFKNFNNPESDNHYTAKFLDFSSILKKEEPELEVDEKVLQLQCNIIAFSSSTEFEVSWDAFSYLNYRPMGAFTAGLEKIMDNPANSNLTYFQVFKKMQENILKSGHKQTPKIQTINGYRERITSKIFLS